MKALLTVDCSNAAFEDSPSCEYARILRELADRVEQRIDFGFEDSYAVHDTNGNFVGALNIVKR